MARHLLRPYLGVAVSPTARRKLRPYLGVGVNLGAVLDVLRNSSDGGKRSRPRRKPRDDG